MESLETEEITIKHQTEK